MKKTALALTLVLLVLITAIVVGIQLISLAMNKAVGELYTYPVSVGEKTYVITIRTNWTYAPEV